MSASISVSTLAQFQGEIGNVEKALTELIRVKKMMDRQSIQVGQLNSQLRQTPIAIIGMASIFPQAHNLQEYWENILHEVDCITDVPASRWNVDTYYDPNPTAPDKTYCKRGGFIPDTDFNPMEFGLPPNILEVTDISQLLSLVVAKQAMKDAGYGEEAAFDRDETGVILGVATGRQLAGNFGARLQYPVWEQVLKSAGLSNEDTQKIIEKIKLAYVQWEENAFPGMLANVISGRIANRLNFGGINCAIDAACASSLAAMKMSISELLEHRCNLVLTGGVDTDNSIFSYLCFSKTPALSKSQQTRPFDIHSDGMMLGEGLGMLVLKRLADAERDGDRIYAVIRGIGTSSDGKFKSIYAPRPEGQVKALKRAYADAGFEPHTVGLIEAHGTGTMAGDPSELTAMKHVFSESQTKLQTIALGSIKSQIGHTKAAAGAASLIKVALALHHKILPATLNVTTPNPKLKLEESPFYLNTKTRPWICSEGAPPRRAGISSFGFGGTNYHIILEEYKGEHCQAYRLHRVPKSLLLVASTPAQLLAECDKLLTQLKSETASQDYATAIATSKLADIPQASARVGFITTSIIDAQTKLQTTIDWLRNKPQMTSWDHPQGIYYRSEGLDLQGKVVALFPGQGSQYLNMGRELAINFPVVRSLFGYMDTLLLQEGMKSLSETVFPTSAFTETEHEAQNAALQCTEYSQPAIGCLSVGLYKILQQAGFQPDFVAGHSFGELTALWAAGVFTDADYCRLVKARGQAMARPTTGEVGTMLAVKGDAKQVEGMIQAFPQVTIANWNSPQQVVLAGATTEIGKVQAVLQETGFNTTPLPVSAAFHTPMVAYAQQPFAQVIGSVQFQVPQIPVYTNLTGQRYESDPLAIQRNLKAHMLNQVRFRQEIETIYAEGGYCFIEFGPKSILTNLVKANLEGRPHLAIALNPNGQKDSDRQLREAVLQLRIAGLPLQDLDPYEYLEPVSPKQKSKLSVRLTASNYISEKTRQAFENALNDGFKLKVVSSKTMPPTVSSGETQPLAPQPEPLNLKPLSTEVSGDRLGALTPESTHLPELILMSDHLLNYPHILESLGASLAQFNRHQSESLQSHQQYLTYQMECTKTFFHLMQQQHSLLANGNPTVVESFDRNMQLFHQYQAETMRVHEQALLHQVEYTRSYASMMQQQYGLLLQEKNVPAKLTVPSLMPTSQGDGFPVTQSTPSANEQAETSVTTAKASTIAKQAEPEILPAVKENLMTAPIAPPPTNGSNHQGRNGTEPITVSEADTAHTNHSSNGSGHDHKAQATTVTSAAPKSELAAKPAAKLPPIQMAPILPPPLVAPSPLTVSPPVIEAVPAPVAAISVEPDSEGTGTPAVSGIDVSILSRTLLEIVSEKTGYPAEMLELEMDMEADLGIDSIKRVEILGTLQERFPDAPKANPEELGELRTLGQILASMQAHAIKFADLGTSTPEASTPEVATPEILVSEPMATHSSNGTNGHTPGVMKAEAIAPPLALSSELDTLSALKIDLSVMSQALLEIVSEKTGYPAEMLELDMDMEADLGIDSIKRVEILGTWQERFPEAPKANPEELGEMRTLGQIIDGMQQFAEKKSTNLSLASL